MKKIVVVVILTALLAVSSPILAAGNKAADEPRNKTIFNWLAGCFSSFDKHFARPGNTHGYFQATGDWMKDFPN